MLLFGKRSQMTSNMVRTKIVKGVIFFSVWPPLDHKKERMEMCLFLNMESACCNVMWEKWPGWVILFVILLNTRAAFVGFVPQLVYGKAPIAAILRNSFLINECTLAPTDFNEKKKKKDLNIIIFPIDQYIWTELWECENIKTCI